MALTATQQAWAELRSAKRVLTVELPAHNGLPAVYLGSETFTAQGTLTATFRGLVSNELVLRRAVGGFLLGGGAAETGVGNVEVADTKNEFAAWTLQDWSERPAIIRWGSPDWLEIGDHIRIPNAFVTSVKSEGASKIIGLRPALNFGGLLLPGRRYDGIFGGESFGEPMQLMIGKVKDAPVQVINPSTLVFGVQSIISVLTPAFIDKVKDNGVTLTFGTDYTKSILGAGNTFDAIDLDNVIGTVTVDVEVNGTTAKQMLATIQSVSQTIFSTYSTITDDSPNLDLLDAGIFIRDELSIANVFDQIALSSGSVWYQVTGAFGDELVFWKTITIPANPVLTLSQDQIQGGVSSVVATRPVDSIVLGVRTSWASSGDDAIDPALPPKVKRDLQKTHSFQVASINQAKVDAQEPPDDLEPIETLLTDSTQAFNEGVRWQQLLSVERRIHSFRALTGAGRIQPADTVRVQHSELSDYSPLVDENGDAITDQNFQPIQQGVDVFVKVLEESFPSGAVQIDGWA